MLNDAGGIETDLTVFRLSETAFMVVTGTGQATKDADWIRRHMNGEAVAVTDVTSAYAVLGVAGPRSEELLQAVSSDALSVADFPRYRHREIEAGYALVRAARLSYTGEAGFELYIPTEFAAGVYDALFEAGAAMGLTDIGTLALTSLRVERGFRAWGHELSAADTPFEAGLDHAVKLAKNVDFTGRDALLRQRDAGLKRRHVFLTLGAAAYPIGSEPILHDGQPVGQVTSATFGHSVGGPVCMGYVERPPAEIEAMAEAGGFAVDIACEAHPATRVSFDPPYAGT
ncbi:MAG: aminomethyltransferase family protein [Magnetovibrio sp.]|nr:aminomethyltransferase family protein [Magnetovibrio sp.]